MKKQTRGQSLIEILLVIALMAIILPGLLSGFIASQGGKPQEGQRIEAVALMKEAEEIIRSVRERDWTSFAVNGTYHPQVSESNAWELVEDSETVNGLTRSLTISDVYRDGNGVIVDSGGNLDTSTKKVEITVSWGLPYFSSVNTTIYLSRYLNNAVFAETTEAEFNQGSSVGVTVVNEEGGEIILGAGGHGSWCTPNLSITAVDLPKNGVANALSAIEGQVVTGTGENASGVSFARVNISNPPYPTPPAGQIDATFDGFKTNDVFGEENFAYLATDTNSREVVIIDLTQQIDGKFVQIGYFDVPGNTDVQSVYVSGNIGFATAYNKLYTFDLTSKTDSRPFLSSIDLAGTGNSLIVRENYVYVAINSVSTQMQIIEVNPAGTSLIALGQVNLSSGVGKDIFVNSTQTRAYLATAASTAAREMYVINIESKTGSLQAVASYEANGMNPKGLAVVPGNKAILVGTGAEEYQVINITNESLDPPMPGCGGMNVDTGINGISSVLESDGDAYSYIITGDATSELKIIEGGPGGQFSLIGTYESSTLDMGAQVAFNRLITSATVPANTTLTFQIAIADAVNNSCASVTFNFVGPDGTADTYFGQSGGIIPSSPSGGYVNPGRCARYKAFLATTDYFVSPEILDVTINYSP